MHRTQIYLQRELHDRLKLRARSAGISISELIRQTLEQGLDQNSSTTASAMASSRARAVFESLAPLESFADTDAQDYVREIRQQSRILRPSQPS